MVHAKVYVHEDPHGALRVGESDVSLDSVVIAYQQGHSAETIQQLYPALSLEEVYGAIAHYLANSNEVHEYLARQAQVWAQARAVSKQDANPVVARLRALRDALSKQPQHEPPALSRRQRPEGSDCIGNAAP